MSVQGNYDVAIVGGGPAGLAVGSELSKKLKVLVIDKGEPPATIKAWFIPKDLVEKNPDVEPYTFGGVTRFMAQTYSGAKARWKTELFDRYPYVKPEILGYWKNIIEKNGSKIVSRCFYEDHLAANGKVVLKTSKGTAEARLLIDASGWNSPILAKYEITHNSYYWWSVFGAVAKHPGGIKKPMEVGDYMLWQTFEDTNLDKNASLRSGRPVFEYEIYDENTSLSLVLWLTREMVDVDFMKEVYLRVIREEKDTEPFHDLEITDKDWRYGWYPSGGLTMRVARDNVAFIGDAGSWCTPCGWGMGFILDNYKGYAKNLIQNINENKLDRSSLENLVSLPVYDQYQTVLNQLASHFLANGTAAQLDKFVKLFNQDSSVHVDPIICEKMFTLKITESDLKTCINAVLKTFELKELIEILPREDYLLLLKLGELSIEEALWDKTYRLLHQGKGPKRPLGDGYSF
ncbi:MAG: NAD(P)-binding domain-containing protein [Nitrospinae bacterium]|nr:NAD(P)-binding domain-containing protein [Nitrospinota bacterium]